MEYEWTCVVLTMIFSTIYQGRNNPYLQLKPNNIVYMIQWETPKLHSHCTGIQSIPNMACGPKSTHSFKNSSFKTGIFLYQKLCLVLRKSGLVGLHCSINTQHVYIKTFVKQTAQTNESGRKNSWYSVTNMKSYLPLCTVPVGEVYDLEEFLVFAFLAHI